MRYQSLASEPCLPDDRRDRGNCFGLVRLALASAVVIGHTPELISGDRLHEPLTALFGTVSLAAIAVLGFFVLSGYLLTVSVTGSGSLVGYFVKRVARIYPGFIVASLVSVMVVAPLAGSVSGLHLADLWRLLLLREPVAHGVFAGAPYPVLNGALWTISYEFSCYFVLAGLYALGLLRRRNLVLMLAVGLMVLTYVLPGIDLHTGAVSFDGPPRNSVRFGTAFLVGVCFRLFLPRSQLNGLLALGCALLLPILLLFQALAEPAFLLLGSYALLWLCHRPDTAFSRHLVPGTDLSYGLYLYAWPLQNFAIWKFGITSPLAVDLLVFAVGGGLALVSWHLVERPAIAAGVRISRRFARRRPPLPMTVEEAGAP